MKKNFLYINQSLKEKNYKLDFINAFNENLCNFSQGFFILSLKCIGNVEIVFGIQDSYKKLDNNYDMIFLHVKSLFEITYEEYLTFKKKISYSQQICLFSDSDNNFTKILNFNKIVIPNLRAIYVANLLKDYHQYNLSNDLRDKLRSTYYGLGFLDIKFNYKTHQLLYPDNISDEKNNDIFFSGNHSNNYRKTVCKFIIKQFPELKKKIFLNNPLRKQDYINSICSSRINLAIRGNNNNITYRHNEILFLNCFFLSDHSFSEFKISENFCNLDSFVYKNIDNLKDLIFFYINADEQREKVRKNLNKIFLSFYSPKKFSESIYNDIFI